MSAPARRLAHRLIREAAKPGLAGESLSPELEAAAARRLGALALMTAGVVAVLTVIGQLTRWLHGGAPRVSMAATALSIVLSLALYAAIASGRVPARLALRHRPRNPPSKPSLRSWTGSSSAASRRTPRRARQASASCPPS